MPALSFLGNYKNTGLLLMRIGIGAMFIIVHGYPKLMGGPERWEKVGGSMKNLGINFFPVAWGFLAASTEAIGGLLLILGLFFRPTCLFLIFVMAVAAITNFSKAGSLFEAAHPIEVGLTFVGLLFLGPGKYSIDKS